MSFNPVEWVDQRPGWHDPLAPIPRNVPHQSDRLREPGGVLISDPFHYANNLIQLYSAVPDSTAPQESVIILTQSNVRRNMLSMRNASASVDIYISFGSPASSASPFLLAAGQTMLLDNVIPQSDVWILASGPLGFIALAYSTLG